MVAAAVAVVQELGFRPITAELVEMAACAAEQAPVVAKAAQPVRAARVVWVVADAPF